MIGPVRGSITVQNASKHYRLGEPRSIFSWRVVPALLRAPDKSRQLEALRDITFTVAPGETVGLIGPNGTGKSTLLRILTGITSPTSGSVACGGRIAGVLDLGSGFYEELNALENARLNAQLLGMARDEATAKLPMIFEFAELSDFQHAPMSQFSFGMKLRLAFSIAMALEPDILLLDEVMGVGDLQFQRRSAAKIRELAERGVTLVVVSHHLSDLTQICQRGLLLHAGQLIHDGPIQQTIDRYLELSQQPTGGTVGGRGAIAAARGIAGKSAGPELPDVEIRGVEVVSESGRFEQTFRTGETITLRMDIHCAGALLRPIFSFGIYREDGLFVANLATDLSGFTTEHCQGENQITLRWECPLLAGGYRISAEVKDASGEISLAVAHSAAGFEVLSRDGSQRGLVQLDGAWSVVAK